MKKAPLIVYALLLAGSAFCLWLAVGGCKKDTAAVTNPMPDSALLAVARVWNRQALDEARPRLRSGDVVLRAGVGPDSYILARLNKKDKSYSHCGIVMIEDGYPFVYHSIGGEDNPDERLRRDSADVFFAPRHNTAIAIVRYDCTAQAIGRLRQVVKEYYRLRPRFDMQFDLATDDKLYCSEFVYKAMIRAMQDTDYIPVTLGMGRRYVGIDDLYLNAHAHTEWKISFK